MMITAQLKARLLGNNLPCYVISRKPLIIVSYWQDFFERKEAFAAACPADRPVYLLAMLGWHRETAARADELAREVADLSLSAPHFHPLILANSPTEESLLTQRGLDAVFCHQNAFLDEKRYRLQAHSKKKYDAIYVARITPFKRHQLAAQIQSLSLIGSWHDYEQDHRDQILQLLAHADWREKVWSPLMYRALNQARVGLCLSAEEGAMFVSAEYLLCGLPLVSTDNLGGRNQLFSAPFALTVEATPEAVAEGVREQIAGGYEPEAIRQAVLEKMRIHRQTLIAQVQAIYERESIDKDFSKEWPDVFTHKLGIRCHLPLRARISHTLSAKAPQ